jgi:GNAT superfamily N-acetyltransferase
LFATGSLAARIERAEAGLIEDGVGGARLRVGAGNVLAVRLAGGVAAFVEPGSPFNKVAGLGFDGVPSEAALESLERELHRRGAPVQIELASLGDPAVAALATRRGYALVSFENVLGLALTPETIAALESRSNEAIRITPVGKSENAAWVDAVATGFLHPDTYDGPASHESFDRAALERVYADTSGAPSFERYLAWWDGRIAGGASLRLGEGVAQLCGAATLPAYRRQGVQGALLRHRLLDAAARGCDIAVVTTQPGSKSQQNVQRFGFSLLYARAILVKAPVIQSPAK